MQKHYDIRMFGSAINGLMSKSSDLDLTVLFDNINLNHEELLFDIGNELSKYQMILDNGIEAHRFETNYPI